MALSLDSLLKHGDDDHDHDHDHDHEDEGMSDVVLAKVVAMVVLFAATLLLGLLPMLLAKKFKWIKDEQTAQDLKSSNKIVLILLSFGGGVLLSTTFLHIIPELAEKVGTLQGKGILDSDMSFHLDALLTCAGFFLMYFVEELVHLYLHRRTHSHPKPPADSALVRSFSIRRSTHNNNCHKEFKPEDSEKQQVATIEEKYAANHNHNHHHHHHSHSHMPVANFEDDAIVSSLRGLLIVLALSIHELFEGLIVGLEKTPEKVWYLFGAISAHKLVIAFCVGVELVSAKIRPVISIIYIFTFGIVSPIGIGIGIALTGNAGAADSLPSLILQGLATGTLVYVVFFEILQRDRSGLIQFTSSLVGFLVMFGLQFVGGHNHSHGEDDDDGHNHNH